MEGKGEGRKFFTTYGFNILMGVKGKWGKSFTSIRLQKLTFLKSQIGIEWRCNGLVKISEFG